MISNFLNIRIDKYQNFKHFKSIKYFISDLTQKNVNKKDLKPFVITLETNYVGVYFEIWAKNVEDIYKNTKVDLNTQKLHYNKKVFKISNPYIDNKNVKDKYIGY